jgi:hypothetical protein
MPLFEQTESLGNRTILYDESNFDYIQGSGRPVMIRVKNLLESWFDEYPGEHKEKLRRNLRGEKPNGQRMKSSLLRSSFHQGFFELYIYILLRKLGCKIVIEPEIQQIEGKLTKPDFLAIHEETGYSFYVEATVQIDERAEKYGGFLKEIKATLDHIQSPEFVICIDRFRITSQHWTPNTNRLARYVKICISDLNLKSSQETLSPPPFQGHGWKLSFYFQPRSEQESWIQSDRTLKETPYTRADLDTFNIRKAINDKASHYGHLDHPFIIAANVRESLITPDTVFEALYGGVSHVFKVVPQEGSVLGDLEFSHFKPKYDGAFRARSPQYTRVSSVWIASSLFDPSHVGSASMYGFENHFAKNRFHPNFPCLRTCYINDEGQLAARDGLSSQQILGIQSHWPADQPYPEIDFSKWFSK